MMFAGVDKWDVIYYLDFFIDMGKRNLGHEIAVAKWENDLEFVRNFDMENQDIVPISEIKKWKSSSK